MSIFNFLSSTWQSLRRRWRKSRSLAVDRSFVRLPLNVSIPRCDERESLSRKIYAVQKQRGAVNVLAFPELSNASRDATTSANTATTPRNARIVATDDEGNRHRCIDETATAVSVRWYCHCLGGPYFTDQDLARAHKTAREARRPS